MPSANSSPDTDLAPPELRGHSQRRNELLEATYQYVLEHGLTGLSLRPLASAIGSSPRVLLFLFGSKDGLIRELLARARADELRGLEEVRRHSADAGAAAVLTVWAWLAAPEHRALLTLWIEAYAQSLVDPGGPWQTFAERTVHDWLALFADLDVATDDIDRTLLLAVLRGALLDLLATRDLQRTTAAVNRYLAAALRSQP